MRVGCLRVTRGRVAESDCRPSHPLVQFFWPDFNLLSFVGVGVYIFFLFMMCMVQMMKGQHERGQGEGQRGSKQHCSLLGKYRFSYSAQTLPS